MQSTELHEHAQKLLQTHGDKAELDAAQKAQKYKDEGKQKQASDWDRIGASIREIRGPHES